MTAFKFIGFLLQYYLTLNSFCMPQPRQTNVKHFHFCLHSEWMLQPITITNNQATAFPSFLEHLTSQTSFSFIILFYIYYKFKFPAFLKIKNLGIYCGIMKHNSVNCLCFFPQYTDNPAWAGSQSRCFLQRNWWCQNTG